MNFKMHTRRHGRLVNCPAGDEHQHNRTTHATTITTTTMKPHGKMHILFEQVGGRPAPSRRRAPGRTSAQSYRHLNIVTHCLIGLLILLSCWQLSPASALYLQQQQQQQQQSSIIVNSQQAGNNQLDNGALVQAVSQMAAQQMASGGLANGLQVTATLTPTGAISLSNNNQQVALVNSNAAITSNQTAAAGANSAGATITMTSANAGPQTGSAAGSSAAATAGGQQQQGTNQFVIKFLHNDSKNQLAYVSITPVNYTNLHEPRIELRYQSKYPFVSLAENSPNNTVVAAVVVNDDDSGPNGETSLAIEQGNELGHFKLVSTSYTNTIQVNGAPLARHLKPEYNLTIVARDHGSPPKASSSTLVIKLHASPANPNGGQAPAHVHPQPYPLEPMPSLKPPVTDLMYVGTMLVVMFTAVIILIIIGCGLVQRPTQKAAKTYKGPAPTRTTSATNSRIMPPTDQCSAYCLNSAYDLSNLNINQSTIK